MCPRHPQCELVSVCVEPTCKDCGLICIECKDNHVKHKTLPLYKFLRQAEEADFRKSADRANDKELKQVKMKIQKLSNLIGNMIEAIQIKSDVQVGPLKKFSNTCDINTCPIQELQSAIKKEIQSASTLNKKSEKIDKIHKWLDEELQRTKSFIQSFQPKETTMKWSELKHKSIMAENSYAQLTDQHNQILLSMQKVQELKNLNLLKLNRNHIKQIRHTFTKQRQRLQERKQQQAIAQFQRNYRSQLPKSAQKSQIMLLEPNSRLLIESDDQKLQTESIKDERPSLPSKKPQSYPMILSQLIVKNNCKWSINIITKGTDQIFIGIISTKIAQYALYDYANIDTQEIKHLSYCICSNGNSYNSASQQYNSNSKSICEKFEAGDVIGVQVSDDMIEFSKNSVSIFFMPILIGEEYRAFVTLAPDTIIQLSK